MAQLQIHIDDAGVIRISVDDERINAVIKFSVDSDTESMPNINFTLPNTKNGRDAAKLLARIPNVDIDYVSV